MDKRELREVYLAKRDQLDTVYRSLASLDITRFLVEQPAYLMSDTILCFVGFRSEVDTKGILLDALQRGKKVFCPKVTGKQEMEFYQIYTLDDLEPGKFGILEPKVREADEAWYEGAFDKTCMVIPGAVFDSLGNRIGYGGGFYDYYLSSHHVSCKIGLGFEQQMISEIPSEQTDQKLDILITEKEVYTFV